MPKATLTFSLPEERWEHSAAIHGGEWKCIVYDTLEHIRQKLKYGHEYKSADAALEGRRATIVSSCTDYSLDPWSD